MKILYTSVILFFVFIKIGVIAQSPNWQWARGAYVGQGGSAVAIGLTTDVWGNAYAIGFFTSGTLTFGNITLSNPNGYIAKYDTAGNVIWATTAVSSDGPSAICTDASGNVYITGAFNYLPLTFGNDSTTGETNVNVGIVKCDPAGNVIWAKMASGDGYGNGNGICTDPNGNVYITGGFDGFIAFGADTFANVGCFLVKCDSAGNMLWALNTLYDYFGTTTGLSIVADACGNVYMTRCTDLSGNGEGYVTFFVMKYDSSGNMLWADPTTGGNYTAITSFASAPYSVIEGSNNICLDANGYIYVTGAFTTPIIVFGNDTLNNVGSTSNIFVVKYDPSGNVVWAKNAGGTGGGIGTSLTVGANGNIYVTGVIYGGTTTFGNFSITTISGSDAVTCAFVAEYDPWGHVMWVQNYGQTTDGSLGISISADAKGDVYVTGDYPEGTIAFGNDTLSNTNDAYNIFTAKLVDTTLSGYLLFDQNICGNICNDSDIMFNPVINGGTPPYTFLWQSTGDSLSCYNCINPTVNITKASVFAVTVIDGNNRSFTDSVFLQSCSHVINDITNLNQQHLITVYPNPTSGKVYFDGVQTGYTLQVYNVLGEIISSSVVDHDNYGVNLSDKAKGMYFYRIADGAKLIQQGKIVVE